MLAVLYAAGIGACIAQRPSPLGYMGGAWAIVALALLTLGAPNIDVLALAGNACLALLGYNVSLVAALMTYGRSSTRHLNV